MKNPGHARLKGIHPIHKSQPLGAMCNRQRMRKSVLLMHELHLEIGLEPSDERSLL